MLLVNVHSRHRFIDRLVTETSKMIIQELYIQKLQKKFNGVRMPSRRPRISSRGSTSSRNCYRLNCIFPLKQKKLC